ncbi:MAG: hypothetical protein JO037_09155 [Actinobacteria bacterium]|nr:hypothetical protein [Actinomycetota bacterium]
MTARFGRKGWLAWVREHVRSGWFGRRGGPGLAGVREPRRPRPPTRPPQAMAAEPEDLGRRAASVATLARDGRRWWWRRRPHAGPA